MSHLHETKVTLFQVVKCFDGYEEKGALIDEVDALCTRQGSGVCL